MVNGQGKHATMGFGILDCAHVKSALPFHIRENLTGQGFWIWEKRREESIYDLGKAKI